VQEAVILRTAISACERGRQHQQALHPLRALQRLAIAPDVTACSAALGQQHQQA